MTIYELSWGHSGQQTKTRYFKPNEQCDAYVRLSERILEMDRDSRVFAAFAALNRIPDSVNLDGQNLVSWTKTSDERPTSEGTTEVPR